MWEEYNHNDASMYPYRKAKKIEPSGEYDEMLHRREIPHVLASIARFGKSVTVDRNVIIESNDIDPRTLPLATRLCAEELEPEDVGYLVTFSLVNQKTVAIRNLATMNASTFRNNKQRDGIEDLSQYTEIVVYDVISRTKSVIFRIAIQERKQSGVYCPYNSNYKKIK